MPSFVRHGPRGTELVELARQGAEVELVWRYPFVRPALRRFDSDVEASAFVLDTVRRLVAEGFVAGGLAEPVSGLRETAAWRAVRSAPDDLAARRVLGRWLAERGDPHGNFILSPSPLSVFDFHEATFFDWDPIDVRARWEGGFIASLSIAARRDSLGDRFDERLADVLASSGAWLLEALAFVDLRPEDVSPVVQALRRAGPHPALRELVLLGRPDPLADAPSIDALWPALPRLEHLEIGVEVELGTFPPTLRALDWLVHASPPHPDRMDLEGVSLRHLGFAHRNALTDATWRRWLDSPACSRLRSLRLPVDDAPDVAPALETPFAAESTLEHLELALDPLELLLAGDRFPALRSVSAARWGHHDGLYHPVTSEVTSVARALSWVAPTPLRVVGRHEPVGRSLPLPGAYAVDMDELVDFAVQADADPFAHHSDGGPFVLDFVAHVWWSKRWGRPLARWWEGVVPERSWNEGRSWAETALDLQVVAPYYEPGDDPVSEGWSVSLWPRPGADVAGPGRTRDDTEVRAPELDGVDAWDRGDPDDPVSWRHFSVGDALWETLVGQAAVVVERSS